DLRAPLQTPVQPCRPCAGEERFVGGWLAADRTVPGSPGGDEAAQHRDKRRAAGQRSADRVEGGVSPSRLAKGPAPARNIRAGSISDFWGEQTNDRPGRQCV